MKIIILFILPILVFSFDASFKCCKASTSIEKYICYDKELAQSDKELGILYGYIKTYSPKKQEKILIKKQRAWAKNRKKVCRIPKIFVEDTKVVQCLKNKYLNRIDELYTIINGDSLELGPWYYTKRDSGDPFAGYYAKFYEVHSATTLEDSSVVESSLSIIKIKDLKIKNRYRVSMNFTCGNYHVCHISDDHDDAMLPYIMMELKDGKLVFVQKNLYNDKVCKLSIEKKTNTLVVNDKNSACIWGYFTCGAHCSLNGYEFKLKTTDKFAQNNTEEKCYPFKKDGKYGFINIRGDWVIKPQFDDAWDFKSNDMAYVKLNGKEGATNRKGEFTPQYLEDTTEDENKSTSDTVQINLSEEKLYALKKGDKYGFINKKGEWVIEPEFEDAHSFNNNGSASVKVNGKWGYINTKSEWIIEPQFDDISVYWYSPWVQYLDKDLVKVKANDKWGIVNTRKGEIVIEPKFEDIDPFDINGLTKVKLGSKEGYINAKGEIVIEPKFDRIIDSFYENSLVEVELNDKWGYINAKGELVIEPKFDTTSSFDENGMAAVKLKGKWGLVDAKGNWILEPQFYEAVEFAKNGLAKVHKDGKYGFINTKGEWAIEPQFEEAENFEGGLATVAKFNGKWGIINTKGKWIIEPQLQSEDIDTSDIYNGVISVTHNGKITIVNAKGKWISNLKFDEIMVIDDADGRVDLNGWMKVKLNGKWGVIDTEGKWVFKPQFDDMSYFVLNNSLLAAKLNGKWGLINTKGKWVLKRQFDAVYPASESEYTEYGIVERNNKYGFINRKGELLLEPLFDKTMSINVDIYFGTDTYIWKKTGLVEIGTHDDKRGIMDRKANWILKQKFDDVEILDDLIYVTFGDQEGYTSLDGRYLTFSEDDIDNARKDEVKKQALEVVVSYAKSCNSGDAAECASLGYKYDIGDDIDQNYLKAAEFYKKACDGGSAWGCRNLGILYKNGEGVKQDYVKAVEFYTKACKSSYATGCHNLGYMYENGLGVKKDDLKAEQLYIEACNKGYAHDCADIGPQNSAKHSKRNSIKNRIRFPYVCYGKKSGNNKENIKYQGCFRSNEKCNNLKKIHFGKYPNDFDAHEAFKRCSKGDPKFVDLEGR